MSEPIENNVIERIKEHLEEVELKYIYVTIPAEYICVYHRILAMLADYGIEMLKDCKATCKDRNSGVIECFNMFNAAVACYNLAAGDENSKYYKEATTLIKYIKTKINQIYKGKDNSTSFVFPVDETGQLKAFVSCGERPRFFISPDDMELYEHKFDNGFDEHFRLGDEDNPSVDNRPNFGSMINSPNIQRLKVVLIPRYEIQGSVYKACADIWVWYDNKPISPTLVDIDYYFDGEPIIRFNDAIGLKQGDVHTFTCVVNFNGATDVAEISAEII